MRTLYKLTVCLFLFFSCVGQVCGQVFDDWEGRSGIAIEHEFENGIGIRARYRHYLDDNLSHYKKSVFGIKVDYDVRITSWLKPGIDYRYRYNSKESSHDIRYFVKVNHEMGNDFELEYSLKFQQVLASNQNPEFYVRNEVELKYLIDKFWSVFIFTENYQKINGGLNFDTQKNGLGTEYKIDNANELEFKFDVKNKSNHKDIARLTLSYTVVLSRIKR
ncbi:MAG TPA: DUF2490 domain-containing protein [Chitinophagaceae bacterium]|nr:DUF2490 domain-containing protein [Chitinophagaceae bacterium]